MKLPNFREHAGLNRLRRAMGAEYKEVDWGGHGWKSMDPEEFRRRLAEGVVVDVSDIDIEPDDTLSVNGERVLVYIRDVGDENKRKFHIAGCFHYKNEREQAIADNRASKYVVSQRTDGWFKMRVQIGYGRPKESLVKLNVCKLCLQKIRYKGYRNHGRYKENKIYENFKLDDFFSLYNKSPINNKPLYNDETAPPNDYSRNQTRINNEVKQEANWVCKNEKCGRDCSEQSRRRYLEVHHVNRNKSDNRRSNLKALCHWCHQKEHGRAPKYPDPDN